MIKLTLFCTRGISSVNLIRFSRLLGGGVQIFVMPFMFGSRLNKLNCRLMVVSDALTCQMSETSKIPQALCFSHKTPQNCTFSQSPKPADYMTEFS